MTEPYVTQSGAMLAQIQGANFHNNGHVAASVAVHDRDEADDDPHRLARIFLGDYQHADGQTLAWWNDDFLAWDGMAYRRKQTSELKAMLGVRIKREFDDVQAHAVQRWLSTVNRGQRPITRRVTTKLISDTTQALAGLTVVPFSTKAPIWFGDAQCQANEVLVCNNTLIHLPSWAAGTDGRFPLSPRLFSENALDFSYTPDAPPPAQWFAFLRAQWENDDESIATLQEWFGYCLLPDTSQHKILLIVGPKRSGKGTIARILRALIGINNTASPTFAGLGTNFGLQPLLGKTLAVIADARLSGRTDVAAVVESLLSISGEDAQTIDRKHQSSVTTTLPVRFVILTNELPRLNDPSGALVGRLITLRQTKSFYGQEDTKLTGRLLGELPSILLWAMEGWKRLRDRGHFVQPKSGQKLIRELEDLSSPIGAFVRERCVVGLEHDVQVCELFGAWKTWCDEKGRKEAGTEQTFGRDLRAVLPSLDTRQARIGTESKRARFYIGIQLREAGEAGENEDG